MRLIVGQVPADAARIAADEIARIAERAITERGRALLAFSGGETPWLMLQHLRTRALDWEKVHVAQVDERIAPADDPRRNLARLEKLLLHDGPLPRANLHAMPVESAVPDAAAADYQRQLEADCGAPLRFDVVQLGLGTDGHTASLVPGDSVLDVLDRDVAVTAMAYQDLRRMTLTYPALDRARHRVWLVTGTAKAAALRDLLERQGDAPAIRVSALDAVVVADAAATRA